MKKLILFTIILFTFNSSFAQKISFSDTTNLWSFIDSNIGCCVLIPTKYTTTFFDSTTFSYHGYTYRNLISSIAIVPIRESSGRVYVLNISDSTERILYDFNLNLYDTLRTNYIQDKYIAWVTNIDSTQLAGNWYKVWHFDGTDSILYYPDSVRTLSYNVIEGIGCTNGMYYPGNPYSLASFSQQLLCFKNELVATSTPLSNPVKAYGFTYFSFYDNDSSCATFYADHSHTIIGNSVNQITLQTENVKVVPNPANESCSIIFPSFFKSGTLIVVNEFGQSVINTTFQNKASVFIGDKLKEPGVYFYYLINNENAQTFSGKIVY